MNPNHVLPLVGYLLLLGSGLIWIVLDAETAYIFDVFGRSFRFAWFDSGRRWNYLGIYGIRLIVLLSLVTSACCLAAWIGVNQARESKYIFATLFAALAILPICLIPWIGIAQGIRWRHLLGRATKQLAPIARQLACDSLASLPLALSEERINDAWTAWHPDDEALWTKNTYPIAYRHGPSGTVYFHLRSEYFREYFLAWADKDREYEIGSLLPLFGDKEVPYRLREAWPLPQSPHWTLIDLDLLLFDDELILESA